MKASFRITNPNMLAEAQAGDLFVPLGPDLVECVCALECRSTVEGKVEVVMAAAARFNPDFPLTIVVVACRVGRDEPEYYPPGYITTLSGAAPIQFLQQCEALQLQPRIGHQDVAHSAGLPPCVVAPAARPDPMYADLDAMQRDMDRINLIGRQRIEALREIRRKTTGSDIPTEVATEWLEAKS